uniref:Metastasis-associated protein MTA3 n=1 Tax=Elaeophora elaphi TaxID=1147741 RepID=A0A158Q878_9BILA
MYRVGDFVYFEISSAAPYQVRKIEELNKTPSGNVEAKVSCFCRRRDLPTSLLKVADRAERIDKVINTRRRLVITSSAPTGDGSDESSDGMKKDDESSPENGQRSNQEAKDDATPITDTREESDSPRPMCVDTGDDEEVESENKDAKEDDEKDRDSEKSKEGGYGFAGLPKGAENLTSKERHVLRQHELYLTRQIEALPATHIRGKCNVTLLSEVETPEMYLDRDDAFFYSLVYDPTAMTLLADKGEIRVGEKYQCDVPDDMAPDAVDENKENGNLVIAEDEDDDETVVTASKREFLVYHPHHNLTDRDIDQFLIVARAVGTFSRALDTSSSMKLPSLHMTAAAASRDVTLFHAMALLHQANYDMGQAVKYLVPPPSKQHYPLDADKTTSHNTVSLGGPILCRDQMEEWSAAEANLFEEAVEKYGKDFSDIRADYLPWKSMRDIVEYYYMWKTTNRYVEVKKNKAVEQESKLKQVYIPNYNKPNPNLVGPPNPSGQPMKGTSACESCQADESTQWYAWGPAHLQLRLCSICWSQWKKYGGLKRVHEYESYDLDGATTQESTSQLQTQSQKFMSAVVTASFINRNSAVPGSSSSTRNGINGRSGSNQMLGRLPSGQAQQKSSGSSVKTRVAFYLNTTLSMRIARRLAPKSLFNIRRSARRPFLPINGHAIKQFCTTRQPYEIIRAAKQIKANKLPDALVAQIASSIIASSAQFTQMGATVSNIQKRHGSDKGGPPIKRQHLQQAIAQTQQQNAIHLVTTGSVGTAHTHYHHPTVVSVATSGVTPPPSFSAAAPSLPPPPPPPTLPPPPPPPPLPPSLPSLPSSQLVSQPLQSPLQAPIAAVHSSTLTTSTIVTKPSLSPSKIVCTNIRNQQSHLGHVTGAANAVHNFSHEANKPVAAVTPLSLPTSVLVPPTIAAVNPALFAATIQQQQQQQQVPHLQAVATIARTTTTTSAPQSQVPQPALVIGIDTIAHDKKTAISTTGSVLATVGTSRKKNFQPDSRWSGLDEKLLFLAGPRLNFMHVAHLFSNIFLDIYSILTKLRMLTRPILRKRICPKKIGRRIALHPCRSSDFVTKHWPNLQGFFI